MKNMKWNLLVLWALPLLTACQSMTNPLRPISATASATWLEVQGSSAEVEVAEGVTLWLPKGPYRARFSDADGDYYQSSQPLVYRTQHNIARGVPGGLYVRRNDTSTAQAWYYPQLGAPKIANVTALPVVLHSPVHAP